MKFSFTLFLCVLHLGLIQAQAPEFGVFVPPNPPTHFKLFNDVEQNHLFYKDDRSVIKYGFDRYEVVGKGKLGDFSRSSQSLSLNGKYIVFDEKEDCMNLDNMQLEKKQVAQRPPDPEGFDYRAAKAYFFSHDKSLLFYMEGRITDTKRVLTIFNTADKRVVAKFDDLGINWGNCRCAVSSDNEYVAILGENAGIGPQTLLAVISISEKRLLYTLKFSRKYLPSDEEIVLLEKRDFLVLGRNNYGFTFYDLSTGREVLDQTFRNYASNPVLFKGPSSKTPIEGFHFDCRVGEIRYSSSEESDLNSLTTKEGVDIDRERVIFNASNTRFVALEKTESPSDLNANLYLFEAGSNSAIKKYTIKLKRDPNGYGSDMISLHNDDVLFFRDWNSPTVKKLDFKTGVVSIAGNFTDVQKKTYYAHVSPDGQFIGYTTINSTTDKRENWFIYQLSPFKLFAQGRCSGDNKDDVYFEFSYDQNTIVAIQPSGKISVLNGKGLLLREFTTNTALDNGSAYASITRDGHYLITGGRIFDLQKGQEISVNIKERDRLILTDDGQYLMNTGLISGTGDNLMDMHDFATQKKQISYVNLPYGDWVVLHPSGYFDGTERGLESMYYTINNKKIALSGLKEQAFVPNLWARTVAGEIFPPLSMDLLKERPTVRIIRPKERNLVVDDNDKPIIESTERQYTVKVIAKSYRARLRQIQIAVNGKITAGEQRNLVVENAPQGNESIEKEYTVNLVRGLNIITASAIDENGISSSVDELHIQFNDNGNTKPANEKTSVRLFALVIGINQYQNTQYNLNYAQPDAKAIADALRAKSSPIFKEVRISELYDGRATLANILLTLDSIKTKAKPEDVFLFYFAGHGFANSSKQGADAPFYLIPTDLTKMSSDGAILEKQGLAAKALQAYSKSIAAQKQVFLLDACQSSTAIADLVASRSFATEKAIAQLARSTGTHWLCATGSEQLASEFAQLGHGSFTYCLLNAINGSDTDGKLTINEIKAKLEVAVPEITAKYKGTAQYPSSYGKGQDFPLFITKN
jgi:hypothetical protein